MSKCKVLASLGFSVLFSLALAYASVEIIRVINGWMLGFVPDCAILEDFPRCQELESILRVSGYVGLISIFIITCLGFLLNKTKLPLLGSLALYLPTIGYFAFTMFFLAGVGVLRFLWLPFIDSEIFIRLGLITFAPMWVVNAVVTWVAKLVMPELSGDFFIPICYAFMVIGLTILFLGTVTWVKDRLQHITLSTGGVYRFSRHPQYLGFIIWSYGLLSLASVVEGGRGWSPPAPGLPWLITVMIILSVALTEEIKLKSKLGSVYVQYAEHTPFIIPTPRVLKDIVTYPTRILIGKEMPATRKEVLAIVCVYLTLVMFISLITSYLVF